LCKYLAMIKNYIKTAFRSLLKNKSFTAINIFGLALGLTTCLLIVFYMIDELSYDRYNTSYERIYRVNSELKYGGTTSTFAITAPPVGKAMVKEFPEVENSTRITPALNIRFKKGTEIIDEPKSVYCDASLFSIFTLPMIEGDHITALKQPSSVVISASAAKKYFQTTKALGKTMVMPGNGGIYKITGVISDMPHQSHFKADFFLPLNDNNNVNWASFKYNTYILLKPGTDTGRLESKFDALLKRNINTKDFNYDKFSAGGNYIKISLIPLTDIHLKSNMQRELSANGNLQYIYIFSAVAVFILILACINFINLSTARSANRAREVGVRKVLGSRRKHLIAQFLSESLIITLAATILAALAAWALLSAFNNLAGTELAISAQTFKWFLPAIFLVIIVVGGLAGSYPAFYLSAFQPVHVLKGRLSTGFKNSFLRSFLVVFQFSISVFLIIGTLVIYNQLKYIQSKNMGFDRNQVLVVKNVTTTNNPAILKQEIKQLPGVLNATLSSFLPTGINRWPNNISTNDGKAIQTEFWTVDEDYVKTMGMTLVWGRNFSKTFPTDSSAMIINEAAAKMIGYKPGSPEVLKKKYHVIGVVKDFNFASLRENVMPLVMVWQQDWMASLSVKVNTAQLPTVLSNIQNKWKQLAPNHQFEYSFMDDDFNAMYDSEQRIGKIFILFASLAIFIACLGLFGLAAYATEQRTREIGIRKILGAGVAPLVFMLNKNFIKLVLIAIVIASPLAWWAMQKWLQGFAYREDLNIYIFLVTSVIAVLIAFFTVSFQSVKAALINPVESLRSE